MRPAGRPKETRINDLPKKAFAWLLRVIAWLAVLILPLAETQSQLAKPGRKTRRMGRWLPGSLRRALLLEIAYWTFQRQRRQRIGMLQAAFNPWSGQSDCPPGPVVLEHGLNIVGSIRSEHGVGESARRCAAAAEAVGLPFAVRDFNFGNQSRTQDDTCAHKLAEDHPYRVNLLHINAEQMPVATRLLGRDFFKGRYNIGFWHWELPEFPDEWRESFEQLDEIWAPSRFVCDAVAAKSSLPVTRMPHAIRFQVTPHVRRAAFGLPEKTFAFLMMYDVRSIAERKNPEGAIQAYCNAFPETTDSLLIVKVNNADAAQAAVRQLRQRTAGRADIVWIENTLGRQAVYNLLGLCDCLVSLHRSEGFGLGLAEAMYLGKPVIGTDWSGNCDFMDAENSCPVGYTLTALTEDHGPYRKGQQWADPDLDQAAWYMRRLTRQSNLADTLGRRARHTIRTAFSPEAVGQRYQRRLSQIAGPTALACSIPTRRVSEERSLADASG